MFIGFDTVNDSVSNVDGYFKTTRTFVGLGPFSCPEDRQMSQAPGKLSADPIGLLGVQVCVFYRAALLHVTSGDPQLRHVQQSVLAPFRLKDSCVVQETMMLN